MKVAASTDLYRAMKAVLERVPALQADTRPESIKSVAKQLAASGVPGAELLAKTDLNALRNVRLDVMQDLFEAKKTSAGVPTGEASKPKQQTALVSGGSVSG